MEYLKKLLEMWQKYPMLTKVGMWVVIVILALFVLSFGFNLFFSFRISIYKQTIYDLKAQMYAREAEAKHAQVQLKLEKKKSELKELERKGEEYAKQREAKRGEIVAAKKDLAKAKAKVDEENSKLGGKTQEEVTSKANQLLNKNKGKKK
jgi:preprotein translocase subunit SecF